jgi:hypothetical protein
LVGLIFLDDTNTTTVYVYTVSLSFKLFCLA